jgi:1-phosphofructokinase family hexose kinase
MSRKTKIVTLTLNPALDLACSVPDFTPGQVNRVLSSRTDAGGKGINIARLLRLYALPVTATGFLGQENPHLFEKLFADTGIVDAFVRVPGETRIGIKILDPVTHTTTDLNLPGLTPDQGHFQTLLKVVEEQAKDASVLVIAGSLPAGMAAETVAELVSVAKAGGAEVFVDTSGPALRHAIAARPTFIKPNVDELSEYVGRPLLDIDDVIAEGRKLVAAGIPYVVVSLGAEGAVFISCEGVVQTRPPKIEAVSTVGAGDALVGSFVAGLSLNLSLLDSARMATAVSAAVVRQAGPGLSSLDEAKHIEKQVLISQNIFQGGSDA